MRTFYALLPNLSSPVGHIYSYHKSLQKSIHLLGWNYVAFVPKRSEFASLPENWRQVLTPDRWDQRKSLWFRLKVLWKNLSPLRKIFKDAEEGSILFLEHFELQFLASCFLALLFTRPRSEFWILHRYAFGAKHFKTRCYRLFHWLLEKKGKVRYLTDSELLAKAQEIDFQRTISVVPIPHTQPGSDRKSQEPLVWWPGGSIREDKGFSQIHKLIARLKGAKLVISEQAQERFGVSPSIVYIPSNLDESAYRSQMEKVDYILLPYNAEQYAKRTSGIFVEAIVSGACPFVTEGTWMAYELKKHQLSELIVDWNTFELPDLLPETRDKLKEMRQRYRDYHSEEGLAKVMESLV